MNTFEALFPRGATFRNFLLLRNRRTSTTAGMGKSHHTARRSKAGSNKGVPGHTLRRLAAERQGDEMAPRQLSKLADVGKCQDKVDGGNSLSEIVTIGPGSSIGR